MITARFCEAAPFGERHARDRRSPTLAPAVAGAAHEATVSAVLATGRRN